MTIFDLTRKRPIELIAIYLSTREGYLSHGGETVYAGGYVAVMTREQLVAAIVRTAEGARLLAEPGVKV